LSEDTGGQWDCEFCRKKKLDSARNCDGEGQAFIKIIYGHEFRQCPLSAIDEESSRIVNFCLLCEGGGFGSSRILPSQLLREMAFYLKIRSIILHEQRRIEKIKEDKKKSK